MFCRKCGGRVFIDRMFAGSKKKSKGDKKSTLEESTNMELFCIMCGKRWFLNREKQGVTQTGRIMGLEPMTYRVTNCYSNQLSYIRHNPFV